MSYISFCSCVYVKSVCPKVGWQGDQIGQFLASWAIFWRLLYVSSRDEVAQRNGSILAPFDLNRQFHNMGCCKYFILVSQNWFDVTFCTFKSRFRLNIVDILVFFDTETVLATFWQIFWVTLFNGQKLTIFVQSVLLSKCQLFQQRKKYKRARLNTIIFLAKPIMNAKLQLSSASLLLDLFSQKG
jgi:hypothetical protein